MSNTAQHIKHLPHLLATYYYHTDGSIRSRKTHKVIGYVNDETVAKPRLRHTIKGKQYYVHRSIYLMMNGTLPDCVIDHIDRNPMNNKIENLRPATFCENSWNRSKNTNNKSGVKGVWTNPKGKHIVQVGFQYENHYVGTFNNIQDAVQARVTFVENLHRDFACHG